MRTIIAGGRDFIPNEEHRLWVIEQLMVLGTKIVVCGMARGADEFGYEIAQELKLKIAKFPVLKEDWNIYGKSAGPLRNEKMAKYADSCILFPGEKGTQHMKDLALKYRLKLIEWK